MYKFLSSLVLLLFLYTSRLMAGDPVFPAGAIPDSMKKDAHLVKRMEEVTQVIAPSLKEVTLTTRYVLTVLDEAGARSSTLIKMYNKHMDVRSISGALYDADGKLVRRLKQSDIKDLSEDGDGSLMTDNRYKVHRFYHNVFPYTVEYEVEERVRGSYWLQPWIPQDSKDCTVEQARFTIMAPADYQLRYTNNKVAPVITTQKDQKVYTWEVKNIPVFTDEPFSKEFLQLSPGVMVAPSVFKIDDYEGNASTWEGLGKFGYALNAGRDELPENIKQKVRDLIAGKNTQAEKIKALYTWMQQNYRYISIQLGIGGLQTFDAKTVAAKGYGDCKALSNYMMSLLKETGIKSYCAWVRAGAGKNYINEAFPRDPFNHVILCVPGEKDTTWLECTSNTSPAGYLGSFTSNRAVMLLTEEGGKLVHTPVAREEDNQQNRTITAVVEDNGNLKLTAKTIRSGESQEELHALLHGLSKEKQLEWLRKSFDLSSYDVGKFECKEIPAVNPVIEEQLELNCKAYATVTGKRIFITPNVLDRDVPKLEANDKRVSELVLKSRFICTDTVNITVPEGYKAEALPAPVTLQNKYGAYTAVITMKGNTISYIRRLERKAGVYPAAEFNEFAKFYTAIYRADRNRIVLVKE
ncbi:DUF3857 domain-containing protein [Chitinophaga flava]|uniref:DUF3857 domain-containing protein n=1 Tax=Chitinophaga flava TaxID=2259036 RepID=A0A365Y1A3_9BACT|nr:DUF3857 domain-containing protein [Chitinophaga flava]RBL91625.1 hypothetical protein DF182_03140 [Chitinophaga flava]